MQVIVIKNNSFNPLISDYINDNPHNLTTFDTYDDVLQISDDKIEQQFFIIDMEDKNLFWRDALSMIKNKFPKINLVLMANSVKIDDMRFAYLNNVVGFIPKTFNDALIKAALNFILVGGVFYPPTFDEMTQRKRNLISENDNISSKQDFVLTNRQEEVLCNLCKGLSNKQIAHEMNLAEATVKLHVNALLRSLGVTNRTHAVITAQKLGVIPNNI